MIKNLVIQGGVPLRGVIRVSGAKNAVLPAMAACLLTRMPCTIRGVPNLADVHCLAEVLRYLGAEVDFDGDSLTIDAARVMPRPIPEVLMRQLRASNLLLGPLLGRFHQVSMAQPGGCNIGTRPMDLHFKGLMALGAIISAEYGFVQAQTSILEGREIHLDYPSVGATENLMMAAVLARGTTVLHNVAREPEIVDLQNFLNSLGGQVSGAGLTVIRVKGVRELGGAEHQVIPDRIEAGTFMVAAAITGGELTLTNVVPEHVKPVVAKLLETGARIQLGTDWLKVCMTGPPRATDFKTMPYPGFPTDMQPQVMALMALAEGTSFITESIFENRFHHVSELCRMGAIIRINERTGMVRGVTRLTGAAVQATDLRAAAALVLAGLAAEGTTTLHDCHHLDRGYELFKDKLLALGSQVYHCPASDGGNYSNEYYDNRPSLPA